MRTPYPISIGIISILISVLNVPFAHAQQVNATSSDLKWVNAPRSLPPGAKIAVLKGDLDKAGTLAFRLKLPDGYQLKPHSSPAISRIVVVSGTFNLGAGDKFDDARTIPLYAGYVHWPDGTPYFAWTKQETVIDIEGVGPWAITYVNSRDDPLKRDK